MSLHGKSILAGKTGQTGGKTFNAFNPATGESLEPKFHEASESEVDNALKASAEAFADFRSRPAEERAKFLETIASEIEALGEALIERGSAETGLPTARITAERGRTCGQLRLFASVVREGSWVDARIDTALPDRQPLPRPDIRRMLRPLGPVVVFGSSNFPLAFSVAGGDTASAFAAGCTVVVKAHRAHPGTAELVGTAIAKAVEKCELPAGVFSLVHGGGRTVGVSMVTHPATTAVGFTGSHFAGRALFNAAAARPHPIPVFAEMSSINPVFLLPGAVKERPGAIATGLVGSFTLGVGQFCTKPGLVFAVRGEATDVFLEKLSAAVKETKCGTMLTPDIRDSFEENRGKITAVDGVTQIAVGSAVAEAIKTDAQPSVSTTDAKNFIARPELATEAFGPFTLVVLADNVEQFTECAAALEGQLTATLHGTDFDLEVAGKLIDAVERIAGRVLINGFPTGVEVCPSMNHGGPYPATTDVRFTSVGTAAMLRFARPVCYQSFADGLLPLELQNANPRKIQRLVNSELKRDGI
jgi:NADP-dependent aldehyde dehydrogenase